MSIFYHGGVLVGGGGCGLRMSGNNSLQKLNQFQSVLRERERDARSASP